MNGKLQTLISYFAPKFEQVKEISLTHKKKKKPYEKKKRIIEKNLHAKRNKTIWKLRFFLEETVISSSRIWNPSKPISQGSWKRVSVRFWFSFSAAKQTEEREEELSVTFQSMAWKKPMKLS